MPIRELMVSLYSGTTTRKMVRIQKIMGYKRLSWGTERRKTKVLKYLILKCTCSSKDVI